MLKNSSLGFVTNVLPSILRFFSRYFFIMYFGDTLLGVNSLFSDVVLLFSFAEMGVFTAVSYFLYQPIAENNTEDIQSFLAVYRKLNLILIILVTVVGVAFIPFLGYIKTSEPISGLLIYYLIFIAQNILSYLFSYREAYITAAQKSYKITHINIIISVSSEILQILVTIITKNFLLYLLTYLALYTVRTFWKNAYIRKHYPDTCFSHAKPLSADTRKLFKKKIASLFVLKISIVGVSQTDSIIVSTMVNVMQWGYVSNYLAIKKMISLVLSSLAGGIIPSLGNLIATENREKQMDSFRLYSFFSAWLCLNIFTCLVILVPPFISLIFGPGRVLDDLTCFLLFFNVLYNGLLEAISVLRDARGLYEVDQWMTFASFIVNLIASVLFVKMFGLPGVFAGTLVSTTVTYGRPYLIWHQVFGGNGKEYYMLCIKTIIESLFIYAMMQFVIHPLIWHWQSNFLGLVISGVITVLITNIVFLIVNHKNPYQQRCKQLVLSTIFRKR